jgi:hypothetical protein
MSCVEIADWFENEDILTNRIKYFTNYKSLEKLFNDNNCEKSHGVKAYINIMQDRSNFIWGLSDFVNLFYNHSKRLVHKRFIGGFLASYEKYANDDCMNEIEYFNEQWSLLDGLKPITRKPPSELYMAFKHLCRKYMIRLFMDYVNSEEAHNFMSFMNTNTISSEESSYARRILTHLSNTTQVITTERNKVATYFNYESAVKLIDDLIVHGRNIDDVTEENIRFFSDILWELNHYLGRCNWAGLLYIQVPRGDIFDKKALLKIIKANWDTYKRIKRGIDDESDVTESPLYATDIERWVIVKLTLAGDLYSMFMPDFENFACRYCEDTTPLLAVKSSSTLQKHLNRVFEETKKCATIVDGIEKKINRSNITWDYTIIKDGVPDKRKYSEQLIITQINYLGLYKDYLNSNVCRINSDEIKKMTNIIEEKIKEYNRLSWTLKNK